MNEECKVFDVEFMEGFVLRTEIEYDKLNFPDSWRLLPKSISNANKPRGQNCISPINHY